MTTVDPTTTAAGEATLLRRPCPPGEEQRPDFGKLLPLLVQLAFLLLLIHRFNVESASFFFLTLLAVGGFLVHYFLPLRRRLSFFLLLSLAGILLFLGPQGAWLLALGGALIGVCHLRVSFRTRVVLVTSMGAVLALQRGGSLQAPWDASLWPILGSMFMFRLILYLHEARQGASPGSLPLRLAYFFPLPNVLFPLFPVVDYRTFCRTYYNDDRHRIYQVGVYWMWRGVLQLILYRYVYLDLTLEPAAVGGLLEWLCYLLSGFLLYLRVSGQFHLIVGMLHLFGFNLPETNHLYFLATSFTDFWRRINIYWKDFMMKIVFYPTFFALRRVGETAALVLSTLAVFVATWFLHSYQWFWIRGSFPVKWPDVIFWGSLALLVLGNSLYEIKHGRPRGLRARPRTLAGSLLLVLRTAGTFTIICLLWSIWTSPSASDWFGLAAEVLGSAAREVRTIIPAFIAAVIALSLAALGVWRLGGRALRSPFPRSVPLLVMASMVFCLLLSVARLSKPVLGTVAAETIFELRTARLNVQDEGLLQAGYYEELQAVERLNTQVWEVLLKRPVGFDPVHPHRIRAIRSSQDFLRSELLPLMTVELMGKPLSTNRWGMRDKDYPQRPPSQGIRIAALGYSTTMGSGVGDGEMYEAVLEDCLNRERDRDTTFEILNFAVHGHSMPQQLLILKDKVFAFAPHAVLVEQHPATPRLAVHHLVRCVRNGWDIPFPALREIVRRSGIGPRTPGAVAERRLDRFSEEIVSWTYDEIVRECVGRGIRPFLVILPSLGEGRWRHAERIPTLAERAGFQIFDLSDVFNRQEASSLRAAAWDAHPNARGHRMIAERLCRLIQENPRLLRPARDAAAPGRPTDSMAVEEH